MIYIANWKMQLGVAESVKLAGRVRPMRGQTIVLSPSFPALEAVGREIKNSTISLGAQDCSSEFKSARTGEVSARMLKELGCTYVIVGHSERRKYHGETDALVAAKARAAVAAGLTPIVCIEKASQAAAVRRIKPLIIAYEPIWAIGTGKAATPAHARTVLLAIRRTVKAPVLYGGSVDGKNMAGFLKVGYEGALIGGASLDPLELARITGTVI